MRCQSLKKTALIAYLFLVFSLLLTSLSPYVIAETEVSRPNVELRRLVEVRDWGLVVINDTVSIVNNGSTPISNFQIGFPSNFSQNLHYVCAHTEQGESLNVVRGVYMGRTGIEGIEITFPKAIDVGEACNFTVTYVFSDLITITMEAYNPAYYIVFPMYPAIAFDAVSCNVSVILPKETVLISGCWEEGGSPILSHVEQPLPAYSNETGFVSFYGTMNLVECEFAKREVVFDSSGQIYFYDSLRIRNRGIDAISTISFSLPKGAYDVVAYDYFGELKTTLSENKTTGIPEATVSLRYPTLRGSTFFDACFFTLKYVVPAKDYAHQTDFWNYIFETEYFSNFHWNIRELTFKITLPEGGEFVDIYGTQGNITKNGYESVLMSTLRDVTPIQGLGVKVSYNYFIFWSAFRPTIWLGLAISVLCAVLAFRRIKGVPTLPTPPETLEFLRDFTDVCDERAALRSELESLEEDYHRGRVRKKEYRRRVKAIERQRFSLDREFVELKKKVTTMGPRFAEAAGRMEVAETEVETVRMSAKRLEARYRGGEISREAFERLTQEYERRIDRAETTIDDVIMWLKGEIR